MSNEWKTLRVVVEVKVRGSATERDLKWAVEQKMMGRAVPSPDHYLRDAGNAVGTLNVKQGSKVIAAAVREDARSHAAAEAAYKRILE